MRQGSYVLATLLLAAAAARAQTELRLELELAADAGWQGPRAWTFMRKEVLPALPEWPKRMRPEQAMRVVVEIPYRVQIERSDGAFTRRVPHDMRQTAYLNGKLEIKDVGRLRGFGWFSGHESWEGRLLIPKTGRLTHITRLLPIEFNNAGSLHVPTVLGWLLVGRECKDLRMLAIEVGGGECGNVLLRAQTTNGKIGITSIVGKSKGPGIILPAALAVIADYHGRPNAGSLTDGPIASNLEHMLMWARAGSGKMQIEAVRELGQFDDPRARQCLEDLLSGPQRVREVAKAVLERREVHASAIPAPTRHVPSKTSAFSILGALLVVVGGIPVFVLTRAWLQRHEQASF